MFSRGVSASVTYICVSAFDASPLCASATAPLTCVRSFENSATPTAGPSMRPHIFSLVMSRVC